MTHDSGDGQMVLEGPDERLRIHWPGLADQPIFGEVRARLQQATQPLGGGFLENPLERLDLIHKSLFTVHPLGGCAMAATAAEGVVNHRGQVFSGPAGEGVHHGLLVADGAIVPVPLGANPLLTISALAERVAATLAEERGWTIDYVASPPLELREARPGATFVERWHGHLPGGEELSLSLTVIARDLVALLADSGYRAAVHGAASLTDGSRTATFQVGGTFGAAPGRVSYHLSLTGDASLELEASRTVPATLAPGLFEAATALSATLERAGEAARRGSLRCDAEDVRRALGSIRVSDAGRDDRLRQAAALARLLYGPLADTYGDVSDPRCPLMPGAAARKRRPSTLRAPLVDCVEVGGTVLRLTHHQGRGQTVLLLHGLGQSSRVFSADTVQPNLVEYLAKQGLDVWLLDCRGSVELDSARQPFDLDQIARLDLPRAVDRVLASAGTESLAVVAHGWGAAAAFMAILSGSTTGVGKLVASQVGCLVDTRPANRLAARAASDDWLAHAGVRVLGGYESDANWLARTWRSTLVRRAARGGIAAVVERLYGPALETRNLTPHALAGLGDVYGPVAIRAGRHVQSMLRAGRLVDAGGHDAYLPGVSRLDLPVLLLQGGANRQFPPSGTERTLAWLQRHGPGDYRRRVVESYGGDDCLLGQHAARDVFPLIAAYLEAELPMSCG
jgi:cholesterol oxidase